MLLVSFAIQADRFQEVIIISQKNISCFVENPFSLCADDKRLYRTGDMVRMKGDGNIEYIGRIDSQVKSEVIV